MKLKYIYSALMAAVLMLGFTACSSDEDTPTTKPEPKVETALTFDTDTVSVGVGETTTFNVTAGGGDYKAFCENQILQHCLFKAMRLLSLLLKMVIRVLLSLMQRATISV